MNDRKTLIRVPALLATIALALLLLVGTYKVIASPSPPAASGEDANHATSWDSGWVFVPNSTSREFSHGLGFPPEQYAVEMWFWDLNDGMGINRRYYGSAEENGNDYGANWHKLTANTIRVYHGQEDTAADRIRIRVWVPPVQPDSDSGWLTILPGETITYYHGLAITATDLTVAMWFSTSNPVMGIHNWGYGGTAYDAYKRMEGAYWHNLTSNSVQVTRYPHDQQVKQVRLVIVHGSTPDYDSLVNPGGWQNLAHGPNVITHGLNWNPHAMMVRSECYGGVLNGGIHQQFAGGIHDWFSGSTGWQGANIQNVTTNTVTIFRQPDDQVCPHARVRIWKRSVQIHLPLVLSSYSSP